MCGVKRRTAEARPERLASEDCKAGKRGLATCGRIPLGPLKKPTQTALGWFFYKTREWDSKAGGDVRSETTHRRGQARALSERRLQSRQARLSDVWPNPTRTSKT
jgi:hypothetical protein